MTPFDWEDSLSLAKRLPNYSGGEAAQRTAISHAYYAAYHAAAIFGAAGILTIGQTHIAVWTALNDDSDHDRRPWRPAWASAHQR